MSTRTASRPAATVAALLLVCAMTAGAAQAASITFTFDCTIVNATTCTPGGPFGTLKLTDSTVDPNRVDLDLTISPHAGVTDVNSIFLNYDNAISLTGKSFRMVSQSAPANNFTTNGTDSVGLNSSGPLGTTLDMTLIPNATFLLTYSGSLVLRANAAPQTESDLNVDMFDLRDNKNLLYAAFNTSPSGTSLNAGATSVTNNNSGGGSGGGSGNVAESSVLVLVAVGLVVIARQRASWIRGRLRRMGERPIA